MTILEELATIEPGLRRRYFLTDHAREIERAVELGELPASESWDPEARWPWLGWRGAPQPEAAGRSLSHLQHLENLPVADRLKFYRAHRNEICYELATFREGHNHF